MRENHSADNDSPISYDTSGIWCPNCEEKVSCERSTEYHGRHGNKATHTDTCPACGHVFFEKTYSNDGA